jgi:hypothetical protein
MVITAMYREASARKLNWMSSYLRFWSQKVHQKHTGNLGSPYPKDFWAGPINLSELPGQDAHISVHRKPGNYQEDPHPPRALHGAIKFPPKGSTQELLVRLPYSQVPDSEDYFHTDPDYSVDDYLS